MKSIFQMSSMGELTFFLGLQVKQKEDGIFISQDKYVVEILEKFDFVSVKTANTPIETQKSLTKDEEAADVDVSGNPKTSHRNAVEENIWLPKGYPNWAIRILECIMYLEAYSHRVDLFHGQCMKQTIVGKFYYRGRVRLRASYGAELVSAASLVNTARPTLSTARLVSTTRQSWCCQAKLVLPGIKVGAARQKFVLLVTVTTVVNDEKQIYATVDRKAVVVTEASIRSSLLLNDADGTACLTNEAIFQNLALMGIEHLIEPRLFRLSKYNLTLVPFRIRSRRP
ncbi:putative ribonuclease H-like domain-containing protein [Tanacetum coccineum]